MTSCTSSRHWIHNQKDSGRFSLTTVITHLFSAPQNRSNTMKVLIEKARNRLCRQLFNLTGQRGDIHLIATGPEKGRVPGYPVDTGVPASLKEKDECVETLRGFAIILVVFGHMIAGMNVRDDSIFQYIHYSLAYVRMPLFAVISGWIYAAKPIKNASRPRFIAGKARRLILPMFVISTLLFVLRMIVPGTNHAANISELPLNFLIPYDVFWFLYSLFLIFLVIAALDIQPLFHRITGWAIAFLTSIVVSFVAEYLLTGVPNLFSFKGATYLLPFFLLGVGIFRFKQLLLSEKVIGIVLLAFVAGVIIQQMSWFGYFPVHDKKSLLGVMVGMSCVLLLFKMRFKNRLLSWVGGYAYAIFLFHVFFTGGSRILLSRIGLENEWAVVTAGVFNAIVFSILTGALFSKNDFSRFFFLGLRKKE
jgi:glucan biosynthesis protein C